MLLIRPEQFHHLADVDARRFRTQVRDFLREQFEGAREMPVGELDAAIVRQLRRADHYGLGTEQQQVIYVTTAFILGEDFDRKFAAAQEVLPSPLYTAPEKCDWMELWTRAMIDALTEDA